MLRCVKLFVALLATMASGAHGSKTCSEIPFCTNLRFSNPESVYQPDLNSLDLNSGSALITLTNSDGSLLLNISALDDDKFRVIIEETDSQRYKVQLCLKEEPAIQSIQYSQITSDGNELELRTSEDSVNKVVVSSNPPRIAFYHDDVLELTIYLDQLIMQNTEDDQSFSFLVTFENCQRMYGIPEHNERIALQHTADGQVDPYRLRTTDGNPPVHSTLAMYGAIPVLYAHGETTSGLFLHNAAEEWIDIDNVNKSAYYMVESGTLDLFVLLGPTLPKTIRQYASLTGTAHLPQLWALGYHQSRWAYGTQDDVQFVIENFDLYDFPLDVLWLDIDYTEDRKWFEWNTVNFADPIGMLNNVSQTHRKIVPINDPHFKIDSDYSVYAHALEHDLFVKNADGTPYVGTCWPGNASWMDYLNPETRDYYGSLFSYDNFPSTSTLGGIWNDMDEPATFEEEYELSIPFDTVHYGNVLHRDIHNMYGFLMTKSTHQGLIERDSGTLRPFILTRSYFAGSQRYAAAWTGDNWCDFDHLYLSYSMCLTGNLVGMPFCGADVPGFLNDPDEELAARWYQASIWLPFMRAHANAGTKRREPYLYSNETQVYIRSAIKMRYAHLPVWYTLFYEHATTGDPVIRPLLYHYPSDENCLTIDDQVMVGENIMAKAVYEYNATSASVYFPGEDDSWFQITGDKRLFKGGTTQDIPVDITFIPVFYRTGSITPRKDDVKRSSTDMFDVPYNLHVVIDQQEEAHGRLYIDDYASFEYQNDNKFSYVNITYQLATQTLTISQIHDYAQYADFPIRITEVMVHTFVDDVMQMVSYRNTSDGSSLLDIDFSQTSSVVVA